MDSLFMQGTIYCKRVATLWISVYQWMGTYFNEGYGKMKSDVKLKM